MNIEPRGLPAALKAWRASDPEPVLTLRCGAAPDCGAVVGVVYRSPQGFVVESRISVPRTSTPGSSSSLGMPDLGAFASDLGVVGMLDDFDVGGPALGDDDSAAAGAGGFPGGPPGAAGDTSGQDGTGGDKGSAAGDDAEAQQTVEAQIDLVSTSHYWHDPVPLCPTHGRLTLDRIALDRAARQGDTVFEATAG